MEGLSEYEELLPILNDIDKLVFNSRPGDYLRYVIKKPFKSKAFFKRDELLHKLNSMGVIEEFTFTVEGDDKVYYFLVTKKFKTVYSQLKQALNKKIVISKKADYFTLSKSKGLCSFMDGSELASYPIKGARYEILSELTNKFQPTDTLAQKLRTSSHNLRGQIRGIRKQISKRLNIQGSDFIIENRGLGYRFGDAYKVTKK